MLSGEASEFLDRAVMRLPLKDELHVDIVGEAITMDERSDYAAFGSKSHGLNKIRQKNRRFRFGKRRFCNIFVAKLRRLDYFKPLKSGVSSPKPLVGSASERKITSLRYAIGS